MVKQIAKTGGDRYLPGCGTAILLWGLLFVLWACGSNSSPPAPPPINPPFAGAISVQAPWALTQSTNPRPAPNGTFTFPQSATATANHDSYLEVPLPVSLNGAQTFTVTYTISGDNPTWVNDSASGNCCGPPAVSLLLHQAGDNMSCGGAFASYRWWSSQIFEQPLALGTHTISVPFVLADWINCVGQFTDAAGFSTAMTHIGSVGICFGGGNAACHGVAVSSGSASFQINSVTIQ